MASQLTFLDLPGEMRNAIYAAYIDDYKPETIELIGRHVRAPPLTRVCQAVRDEFRSLWGNRSTDISQVFTVKAAVFDFYVDGLELYFNQHARDFHQSCKSVHIRFVMTRAGRCLSAGNLEHTFRRLLDWQRHCDRLQRTEGVVTTYSAGFWPKKLNFEDTRCAKRLFSAQDQTLEPIWIAVRDAVRKQNGQSTRTT